MLVYNLHIKIFEAPDNYVPRYQVLIDSDTWKDNYAHRRYKELGFNLKFEKDVTVYCHEAVKAIERGVGNIVEDANRTEEDLDIKHLNDIL